MSARAKPGAPARKRRAKRDALRPDGDAPSGLPEAKPEPSIEAKPEPNGRDKPWKDRRGMIEAIVDQLRGPLSPQQLRVLADQLLRASEDPKWEVRLAVARAIASLEHPDYATIASKLEVDDNSYVAKAARDSAARRRELDRAFQAKTDEIDEVTVELAKLREAHGERVAAAAERVAEHKFRLLTNETTHEMRTVVASLLDALGKLDTSLSGSSTAKQLYERPLRIARERANFLQLMLDDTKRLVDEPKLEREDVAVTELLDKVAEIVRDALAIPPEVRFEVEVSTRPGTCVHVPRVRLLQALSSLAKNAIEAVEGQGHVVLGASTPKRGWVALTVADDGYGMDPEEIHQALLPMVSTKKDDKHTGVGLPLAKKIIERECRGELKIDSEPERGTTMICLLPISTD
ncbi:MAG TPA: HAMP domain-containing sensor histidine kinase [Enhygromyxa sp.]|nr:HAMP domain-containing sensor histidine kinase [Enhygromyxa sp.]